MRELRRANPPNPWHSTHVEWLGEAPVAKFKVFEQDAKSIVTENKSPDIPFRFGINAYRGCQHACAYCYARPSHQHLDFGAGSDFERKIVVKVNAPELLKARFDRRSWTGETICFSGNTDCYQPLEATYELTRRCLQICAEYRNPVVIITKGTLIRRDLDVLESLAADALLKVWVSCAFSDDTYRRALEPGTPTLKQRMKTMSILADRGIDVGVSCSPIIPGLNEAQIADVLKDAAEAGATSAFMTLLRLPGEVRHVFEERLSATLPERAKRVLNAFEDVRSGQNNSDFGTRMRGNGPRWEMIRSLFTQHCRKLGLNEGERNRPQQSPFRRPTDQVDLFQ